MPEMDYSTQAAQAKLASDAARAAEARMRDEGLDVASPEGMRMDEGDLLEEDEENGEEATGAPEDDLPNASIQSSAMITPEEEAELHGVTSNANLEGEDAEADSSDGGDELDGGSEVHDAGVKTS